MHRLRSRWLAGLTAGMILGAAGSCFAQAGSLFGSNGALSQSSAGGIRTNGSNGTAFGNSGFPSFGGTGSSTGSGTSSTFGGVANTLTGGNTGGNVARTSGLNNQAGTSRNGQTQNGGVNRNTGRLGQQGLGNNRLGQNGLGRNNRNQNSNNINGLGQDNNAEPQAQARIRPQVSFNFSRRPIRAVNTAIQGNFTRIARRGPDFGNIDFELGESGEVVLRGTIPSEETGRLAAALVRLEPGVRSVKNELTLVPAPTPVD